MGGRATTPVIISHQADAEDHNEEVPVEDHHAPEEETEDHEEPPIEQQIYEVFLEGTNGDHDAAWQFYQRFRAHQERKAQRERAYSAILEELGNEELAQGLYELWVEWEEEEDWEEGDGWQEDNSEDEEDGETIAPLEDDQVMLARARLLARGYRLGHELSHQPWAGVPASWTSEVDAGAQTTGVEQETGDDHDGETEKSEVARRVTTSGGISTYRHNIRRVNSRLDALLRSFEQDAEAASSDENSKLEEKNESSTLVDLDIETPDPYGSLGLWAQRFEDAHGNNSQTNEASAVDQTSKTQDENNSSVLVDLDTVTPNPYDSFGVWGRRFEDAHDGNSQPIDHPPNDHPSNTHPSHNYPSKELSTSKPSTNEHLPKKQSPKADKTPPTGTTATDLEDVFVDSGMTTENLANNTTPIYADIPIRFPTPKDFLRKYL
ncbi:hypothetical protein B0T20DRAFT_390711 [Sordaria brevicollis]|uniref:Uncharacterized protein n=1 Tax=Sordaria brevicollis TaxID=83679 RepID=A0AAE0UE83_SORBR|nr:hypothetical protein B0T20DRAFT_390711 [Sordaria brevicollis]